MCSDLNNCNNKMGVVLMRRKDKGEPEVAGDQVNHNYATTRERAHPTGMAMLAVQDGKTGWF